MTNYGKLVLTSSALLAISLGATGAAAAPASANAVAKAKILKQLTITKSSDLDFGTIVTGTVASTVAIDATGAATCGTGLTCSGTRTAANFTVKGSNNQVVTVSVPATVTLNGGGSSMIANLSAPATLDLGNSGSVGTALNFGGTLNVGANQVDAVYQSADFAVTVNYQ